MRVKSKTIVACLICAQGLSGCSHTHRESNVRPLSYSFESTNDLALKRFKLKFQSNDSRSICFTVEQWPSTIGHVDGGSQVASVLIHGQSFPALDANFGLCPGGCGYIRVKPGQTLTGAIGYDQFPSAGSLLNQPHKTLQFTVYPTQCRGDMKIVDPR